MAIEHSSSLQLLSVIIPARDEEGCICSTVQHLNLELRLQKVPHEIIVVDDGSSDRTWQLLQDLQNNLQELKPIQNQGLKGFGQRHYLRPESYDRGRRCHHDG